MERYVVDGEVLTISGGGAPGSGSSWNVSCTGRPDHAHYSKGAGGAIFKTYVHCNATGVGYPAAVSVRVRGLLSLAYAERPTDVDRIVWHKMAESDKVQVVPVTGAEVPFYTPEEGKNAGFGGGFWLSTATWQIVAPLVSNVTSGQSQVFKKTIP